MLDSLIIYQGKAYKEWEVLWTAPARAIQQWEHHVYVPKKLWICLLPKTSVSPLGARPLREWPPQPPYHNHQDPAICCWGVPSPRSEQRPWETQARHGLICITPARDPRRVLAEPSRPQVPPGQGREPLAIGSGTRCPSPCSCRDPHHRLGWEGAKETRNPASVWTVSCQNLGNYSVEQTHFVPKPTNNSPSIKSYKWTFLEKYTDLNSSKWKRKVKCPIKRV